MSGIFQSSRLSLKCDHPFLCEFFTLFSTVKLNLGHNFSQCIHRFKIWSRIHKRDGKLGFLKSLDCTSKFSQFTKKFQNWNFSPFAFIFCQMVRMVLSDAVYVVLQVRHIQRQRGGANLWLNQQFSRKKYVYIVM